MPDGETTTRRFFISRMHFIDNMIKEGKYPNSRQLAELLEVSRRTILRDVEFMRDRLGAPLAFCPKKRGYYYAEEGFSLRFVRLTEGELVALYLGHNLLKKCAGRPYEREINRAFQKICASLPEIVTVDFADISENVEFEVEPLRGEEEKVAQNFAAIGAAINKRQAVEMVHYSIDRDEETKRTVDPLHLRYFRGAWYLIAYCHLRQEMRIFALDRIKEVFPAGKRLFRQDDFDLAVYLQDSFQFFRGNVPSLVKIWFSPKRARRIKEKQWHPSQKLSFQEDGSLIMELTVSGLEKVKSWVLSFGAAARVISPPELAAAVRSELQQAYANYNH